MKTQTPLPGFHPPTCRKRDLCRHGVFKKIDDHVDSVSAPCYWNNPVAETTLLLEQPNCWNNPIAGTILLLEQPYCRNNPMAETLLLEVGLTLLLEQLFAGTHNCSDKKTNPLYLVWKCVLSVPR